jgi:dephospho-CoA kinase
MLRVGLTGGLASGKSFVGEQLKKLGCYLIKADDLGHAALEPGGEAYDATVAEFGPGILRQDGFIDRRRLASLVFNDPERLARLNSFVHPAVRARAQKMAEEWVAADPRAILVTEAAILVETGSYRNYDRLIVAMCSGEQQVERAMHRDGITREEALARLRRQLPLSEKVKYADFIIDTSGSKENTIQQTRHLYEAQRRIEEG